MQRLMSGMRPTGALHLGNWAGALANWVTLQRSFACYFMVADWHALTTGYEDTSGLEESTAEMVMDWLSLGLDPEAAVIFRQSMVKAHAELYLLFAMVTPLGWLERVPTYKEQLRELAEREVATYGFLGYPVLQAADILAYRAEVVPVGQDQSSHVELTREIARRFNHVFGTALPEPEARLTPSPVLLGTDGRKMSKSYGNTITFRDSAQEVTAKVRGMVTDPARVRRTDPGTPEVCPVFALHRIYNPEGAEEIARGCRTAALGCVACKAMLAERLNAALEPVRERRFALTARPGLVEEVLAAGSARAAAEAEVTLGALRAAVGVR